MLDVIAVSSVTAAVSLLSQEFGKGLASEAGKATWARVKTLFGWHTDPPLAEIPAKVVDGLTLSPELLEKLLDVLKSQEAGAASSLVGSLTVYGGKVVTAQSIQSITM